MALNAYIAQARRLLNDPNAQFFSAADLTAYVNLGRNQIAVQTECLVASATISLSTQSFVLSGLSTPTNYGVPINARSLSTVAASVPTLMDGRPWAWFRLYCLNGAITAAKPRVWSVQSQGQLGTVFVSPTPDTTYSVSVEASWTPAALVDDTTVEALPYPWTDVVPYWTAYLGLLSAQRPDDALKMWAETMKFIKASRLGVTPEIMPPNFPGLKTLDGAGGEGAL